MKLITNKKVLKLDKRLLNEASKLYPTLNAATDFHNYLVQSLEKAGFKIMLEGDFTSGKHEFSDIVVLSEIIEVPARKLLWQAIKELFKRKKD